MVKYSDDALDTLFAALADRTRRRVLDELAGGGAPVSAQVSQLAAAHDMSLPGFMKHLAVLEAAGLIARAKEGRVVSCELSAAPMQAAAAWMSRYEKFWTERLDALGRYLYQQEELQAWTPKSRRNPSSTSAGTTRSRPRKSGGRGPTRRR